MRTVSFVLIDSSTRQVEETLASGGCERLTELPGRWNYPAGPHAILFLSCGEYCWQEFDEEHRDILRHTGGRVPNVIVDVDVSGRSPGNSEVRFIADLLLSQFDGFAFDDFVSLDHGWTIDEIRDDEIVNGLRFFDYVGAHAGRLRGPG